MPEITTTQHEAQPTFTYSPREMEWLWLCLSRERMQPYLVRARQDQWVAFHLYIRNTELSASLYGVVQALEVGLRNVVHSRLTEVAKGETWWDSLPLHDGERNDVQRAKEIISARTARPIKPGHIVAELSFGFWVKLFANAYEKSLWVPSLSMRFPAKLSRKFLHERLVTLKDLRNRIAHHETLLHRDLQLDFASLLEAIGWLSPSYKRWVEQHGNFPTVFAKRLPKQEKTSAASSLRT